VQRHRSRTRACSAAELASLGGRNMREVTTRGDGVDEALNGVTPRSRTSAAGEAEPAMTQGLNLINRGAVDVGADREG